MVKTTQLSRLGLFDAKVPRYTSYPTAPHFSENVGELDFLSWIEALQPGSSVSLYIHVPFCRRLCWFCACRTQGTQSAEPVRAYVDMLIEELSILSRHLPAGVNYPDCIGGEGRQRCCLLI